MRAEWEKAARGTDGRAYPWGDALDPDRANYHGTGIGTTSAVGCFPKGASLYGVEDLTLKLSLPGVPLTGASLYGVEDLGGNVWEWTRSKEGKYPYPQQKTTRARRENLRSRVDEYRVLRGGAFWFSPQSVRCACRYESDARGWYDSVGMRVVVAALP